MSEERESTGHRGRNPQPFPDLNQPMRQESRVPDRLRPLAKLSIARVGLQRPASRLIGFDRRCTDTPYLYDQYQPSLSTVLNTD